MAIFADHDDFELVELGLDLPLEDGTTGHGEARWGDAYVTPLLLAADEDEHYLFVHIDRDHARLLEVSLGGVEEIDSKTRQKSPKEIDIAQSAKRTRLPWVASRGNAGRQLADEHVRDLSRAFHAEVADRVAEIFRERDLERVILAGTSEDTAQLEASMSAPVRDRVVERLPSFPNRRISPEEIRDRLSPVIEDLRDRRELGLLERVVETGVFGLPQTLEALELGRLRTVIAPWPSDDLVYFDPDKDRHVAFPRGGQIAHRLLDLLPSLTARFDTGLELVTGRGRHLLEEQLGGLAGIRRW